MPAVARNHHQDTTPDSKPANDPGVAEEQAPIYELTATQYAVWLTRAKEILPEQVKTAPTNLAQRIEWLERVQAAAWHDRHAIVAIVLPGKPLTEADVDDFGYRIAFLGEVVAQRDVSDLRAEAMHPGVMSDRDLKLEMTEKRGVLCDALALYFTADAEQQKAVVKIRNARRVGQHTASNRNIFQVFKNRDLAVWLRALRQGEGAALDRLRLLGAEWVRRRKGHSGGTVAASGDLVARAWALACEPLVGILARGRYLTKRRPDRKGDYAGFRLSPAHSHAVAVVVPPPAPVPTPTA